MIKSSSHYNYIRKLSDAMQLEPTAITWENADCYLVKWDFLIKQDTSHATLQRQHAESLNKRTQIVELAEKLKVPIKYVYPIIRSPLKSDEGTVWRIRLVIPKFFD